MNKSDLIRYVNFSVKTSGHDLTMTEVEAVVDALLSGMLNCFDMNEDVLLSGFGKFIVDEVPGCTRRNPQNGEKIFVPPKRKVKFRLSTKVKERLNGGRR